MSPELLCANKANFTENVFIHAFITKYLLNSHHSCAVCKNLTNCFWGFFLALCNIIIIKNIYFIRLVRQGRLIFQEISLKKKKWKKGGGLPCSKALQQGYYVRGKFRPNHIPKNMFSQCLTSLFFPLSLNRRVL